MQEASTVSCRVCGIRRRRLAFHLRSAHSMSKDAYLSLYPEALMEVPGNRKKSPETRRKMSKSAKKRWAEPSQRKAQSERMRVSAPWKGKHLSPEHREAISKGGKGVPHNISEQRRRELAGIGRRMMAEFHSDPEVLAKIGKATSRRIAAKEIGWGNPVIWRKGFETRLRNGNVPPLHSGRGISGFRKGIPHYCRSTLEANFARILICEGIPYEYEPKSFIFADGTRWTPDFFLQRGLEGIPSGWVELKGWRYRDGTLPLGCSAKIRKFEELTGESVFLIVQKEMLWQRLKAAFSKKVEWERRKFNLRTHPEVFGRDG